MALALDEARAAAQAGEAPIGAVLHDPAADRIVARAHNRTIRDVDPSGHAEILVLRAGAAALDNHRLTGLDLIVTLEPCAMCAGAIAHARIRRLLFAASDPKGGGVLHGPRVFDQPTTHHRPRIAHGLMAEEAGGLLKGFFQSLRRRQG